MTLAVRRVRADEVHLGIPILRPEGWTFEPHELARLHALGGAVAAFDGDETVGFLTFVETPPYRWIGNVAVAEKARGKGVGRRMIDEAARGADRVALYSVEKAIPLYERAGLAAKGAVQALRATSARPGPGRAGLLAPALMTSALALDREVTRMDRSALLRALLAAYPARAVVADGALAAFGIAKTYADVTEVGPIVARTPEAAAAVLDEILRETPGPHDIAVPTENAPALAAAKERGFEPTFRPTPMFRGPPPTWDLSRYHAVAGLEKG